MIIFKVSALPIKSESTVSVEASPVATSVFALALVLIYYFSPGARPGFDLVADLFAVDGLDPGGHHHLLPALGPADSAIQPGGVLLGLATHLRQPTLGRPGQPVVRFYWPPKR
jgi:hypothetical protein